MKNNLFSERGKKDKIKLIIDAAGLSQDKNFRYNKLDAEVKSGFKEIEFCLPTGKCYNSDNKSKIEIPLEGELGKLVEIDISYKIARINEVPVVDLRYFFSSGNAGCYLPVFEK